MKKRGPICARCGVMVLPQDAVIMRVDGELAWAHKNAEACGA